MKIKFSLLIVALVALFVGAQAQKANVTYTARNGQGKILLTSTVTKMDSANVGLRIITVSNNASMVPVIQLKSDSIFKKRICLDTIYVSLSYPTIFYVSEMLITKDTSGVIDTATALSFIPVMITPPFVKPSMVLQNPTAGSTTASFNTDFNSGFDTLFVKVYVSYGDWIFQYPSPVAAYTDTILPVIGSINQTVSKTITFPLNSTSYKFSYKVKIWNSVKDSLSPVFYGTTLSGSAPAMVSSPYSKSASCDSISYSDQTVTNGIKTKHVAYIATSNTNPPFDSIITMIAGQGDGVTLKNVFTKLNPSSNYYIWSCVTDTVFKTSNCANKVLVQTSAKPTTFVLKIDSSHSTGWSTQRTFSTVTVGTGHTGYTAILMSKYGDQNNLLVIGSLKSFSSGINNFEFDLTNLSVGQKYAYTIYGYDTAYSNSYSAWVLTDTFTFKRPVQGTGINLKEKSSSMVYSNPSLGWIKVNTSGPYEILNLSGTTVKKGILEEDARIDVSTLPRGIFIVRTQKGAYKFAR